MLWQDLRYALRTFRRSPGFVVAAVVPLAVGIATATGLFSIVNAALVNPFPFADINRLVRLDMIDKGKPRGLLVTARQLVALQRSEVLDGAFALNTWEMTLTGHDVPEVVPTQYLSANGLNVLGVPPLLGRVFNEADGPAGQQAQRVVVLTYRFWQRHFGGRAEAVGQTLSLNRESYTVIGVLPRQYFSTGSEQIVVPIDLKFDPNLRGPSRPVTSGASIHASPNSDFSRFSTNSPGRPRNAFRKTRIRSYTVSLRHEGRAALCRPSC